MPEQVTIGIARPERVRVTDLWYVLNGRSYPRVSTVLDIVAEPGLDEWREKVGEEEARRISEESTLLGDAVHAACANLSRAKAGWDLEPVSEAEERVGSERLAPFTDSFAAWLEEDVAEVLAVELLVWSDDPAYAGTIDLVVRTRDGLVVVEDLKTSKRVRTKYRMQTAAYRRALHERTGLLADRRGVVHLPSDRPGKLKTVMFPDHDDDEQAFMAALFLHQYAWFYRRDFML